MIIARSLRNLLYIAVMFLPGINKIIVLHLFCFVFFFAEGGLNAQEWQLAKEKDGITLYSRKEPGSNFKAFRGEVEFQADIREVFAIVEDVQKFDEWDDDVSLIRVIEHEEGKLIRYYVVYDVPWPFTDRDLCIETSIMDDEKTGSRLMISKAVPEILPAEPGLVRIVNYWQKWIIQPKENGYVHITMEGFADPAGDIPGWIANMAVTDSPFNTLKSIRNHLE